MYRQISACRLCDGGRLDVVLELGRQALTGVFPRRADAPLTAGPLTLVRCADCGLVQLLHSYERSDLYGAHYGYRSSLNAMMATHLQTKARALTERLSLAPGDVVVDIGSNDGTLLSFFAGRGLTLVGFDPSAERWRDRYPPEAELIADFFSPDLYHARFGTRKARLVTSIARFYDLKRPLEFMEDVRSILAGDGVWHTEQSYLALMLAVNAYDTVCHEHLEYYAMKPLVWMAERSGLDVLDVALNDVNGGSFAVTLSHRVAGRAPSVAVERLLADETRAGFDTLAPYDRFRDTVLAHRRDLVSLLETLRCEGRTVLGYGASTKGNVILQFAGITPALLPMIAEINEDKVGCFTPGTGIPIIAEREAHAIKPDYFLVFPWHFRRGLLEREAAYLRAGGKLIFPLPQIEIVPGGER